jgi:hypothetical protein
MCGFDPIRPFGASGRRLHLQGGTANVSPGTSAHTSRTLPTATHHRPTEGQAAWGAGGYSSAIPHTTVSTASPAELSTSAFAPPLMTASPSGPTPAARHRPRAAGSRGSRPRCVNRRVRTA